MNESLKGRMMERTTQIHGTALHWIFVLTSS